MTASCIMGIGPLFEGYNGRGMALTHPLPTGTQLKNKPFLPALVLPAWRYGETLLVNVRFEGLHRKF